MPDRMFIVEVSTNGYSLMVRAKDMEEAIAKIKKEWFELTHNGLDILCCYESTYKKWSP